MKNTNTSSNSSSEAPILEKRFECQRAFGDLMRVLELSLDNHRIAPRVRHDIGTREVQIELESDVTIVATAIESYRTHVVISTRRGNIRAFGNAVAAVHSIPRIRERKSKDQRGPGRPRVSRPDTELYAAQLLRIGITSPIPVNSLEQFLRILAAHPFTRLEVVIPDRVLGQAKRCRFHNPLLLAERVADILIRSLNRCPRCGHFDTYHFIPGFRSNLSDTQLNQFGEDYRITHKGKVYEGRLHLTIGVSHSKNRCASIHWCLEDGLLVLTRIGTHGRNAHS